MGSFLKIMLFLAGLFVATIADEIIMQHGLVLVTQKNFD